MLVPAYACELSHASHELRIQGFELTVEFLSLGIELQKEGPVSVSLQYGISQIIPFYVDYKDYLADSDGDSNSKPSGGIIGSIVNPNEQVAKDKSGSLERSASALLFRNGFATHLGIAVKF